MRLRARLSPNRDPIGQGRGRVLRGGERLSDSVKNGGMERGRSVSARSAVVSPPTIPSRSSSTSTGTTRVVASRPTSAAKPTPDPKLKAPAKLEPSDRPGASGHRFGPDLACSECGIQWDVHQREPHPCKIDLEEESDAFLRRPAPPAASVEVDPEPSGSTTKSSLTSDSARSATEVSDSHASTISPASPASPADSTPDR